MESTGERLESVLGDVEKFCGQGTETITSSVGMCCSEGASAAVVGIARAWTLLRMTGIADDVIPADKPLNKSG